MSESEQVEWFVGEVQRVIKRAASEFEMTNAAVVGSLEIVKLGIIVKLREEEQ